MELQLNPALQRAHLLVEHKRYAEAEKELRNLLSQAPEHVIALLMLTETLLEQDKVAEAEKVSQQALALDPSSSIVHYTHARVLYTKERNKEAVTAVQQAIALDPVNASYYGLLSALQMEERQYEAALETADMGLRFEPEHVLCLNIRSRVLFKLGRKQEAVATIDKALEQDPDNANTHANYGWACLEKNEIKQSLEHFRAALQLDPTQEFAKEGMQQALKARYLPYRLYLRYAFWISNQSKTQKWVFLIGIYVIFRFVRSLADNNEELAPFLMPIIMLYFVFVFSSWLMNPIGNLFLMLNAYGRYTLSENDRKSATYVGISLAVSALSFLSFALFGLQGFMALGFLGFSLMLPLGTLYAPSKPKDQKFLMFYTLGLLAAGIGAVSLSFINGELFNGFSTLYLLGLIAYQWVANAKMIR